jgi:thioredoxin 1
MLYTNLKHLENSEEHALAIHTNNPVVVVCGRMDYGCIPVYRIFEELEKSYPVVKFFDMDFDNPESRVISSLPQLRDMVNIPLVVCYKDGKVVDVAAGIQPKEVITGMLDRQFSTLVNA